MYKKAWTYDNKKQVKSSSHIQFGQKQHTQKQDTVPLRCLGDKFAPEHNKQWPGAPKLRGTTSLTTGSGSSPIACGLSYNLTTLEAC